MKDRSTLVTTLALAALASGCAEPDPANPPMARNAATAAPAAEPDGALESETGDATYYADALDRERTASGEPLDQRAMVAAHRRFPFGTILRVTNLENDREVRVRVIDWGPFGAPKGGVERVIDLSRGAADRLGFVEAGSTPVKVEVIEYGGGLPVSS